MRVLFAAVIAAVALAPGAYRLFVYAYDGQGHAAHANIPLPVVAMQK